METSARLEAMRRLQRFLDEAFRIPGTRMRFGWDSIIGLVPGAGDLTTALMSGAIILHAHRTGVPRIVQLRMLLNVGLDLLVGLVPFAGDVADVFWKANTRNLALLERHSAPLRSSTRGDWIFVAGLAGVLVVMAAIPVLLLSWMVSALVGRGLF